MWSSPLASLVGFGAGSVDASVMDFNYTSTSNNIIWTGTTTSNTTTGQVSWQVKPVLDDDDDGSAGVREPRRPSPCPAAPAIALPEPD